jgi:hypothetical protein
MYDKFNSELLKQITDSDKHILKSYSELINETFKRKSLSELNK